ncbi:MAG: tRNA pseudouridine(38-40) synthase TruA [Acidobacteria bacterium]|nr:tRNA pseudouridine(38-40) synthase TruA [Acidobacteriota bacterium]
MPTYRLDLEYQGTRYRGWQVQENARSIAGEIRRAFEAAGFPIVDLGGSGRTDAGVHALRQTAHLRLREPVEVGRLREAVNSRLPHDIHVLAAARAADSFHARHDAVARSYLYQVARRRTGLAKTFVWWVREPLDPGAMAAAAAGFVGRHDFLRFCERPREQESTIVVVEGTEVAEAGGLILVRLVASHFLWKMVRRVVGALVRAGTGNLAPDALRRILAGEAGEDPECQPARWTAPPSGLFLERVLYPGEPPLGPLLPAVPVGAEKAPPENLFLGREDRIPGEGVRDSASVPSRRAGAKPARPARLRRPSGV